MLKYNWFDDLLYHMILLGGDKDDLEYITNYRNKCIEQGILKIKKYDYIHIKTNQMNNCNCYNNILGDIFSILTIITFIFYIEEICIKIAKLTKKLHYKQQKY